MLKITCPCCEHSEDYIKWHNISNDNHLICPVCQNVIQYEEVREQLPVN